MASGLPRRLSPLLPHGGGLGPRARCLLTPGLADRRQADAWVGFAPLRPKGPSGPGLGASGPLPLVPIGEGGRGRSSKCQVLPQPARTVLTGRGRGRMRIPLGARIGALTLGRPLRLACQVARLCRQLGRVLVTGCLRRLGVCFPEPMGLLHPQCPGMPARVVNLSVAFHATGGVAETQNLVAGALGVVVGLLEGVDAVGVPLREGPAVLP